MSNDEDMEKPEFSLLMGVWNDAATSQSTFEVSQEVKNKVTTWPSISNPKILWDKDKSAKVYLWNTFGK